MVEVLGLRTDGVTDLLTVWAVEKIMCTVRQRYSVASIINTVCSFPNENSKENTRGDDDSDTKRTGRGPSSSNWCS